MMIWMYQTQWTYMVFTIPLPTCWLLRVGRNIEDTSSRKQVSLVQFLGSMQVWRRLMEALRLERVRLFCLFCMSTSIGKSNGIFQLKGDGIRTVEARVLGLRWSTFARFLVRFCRNVIYFLDAVLRFYKTKRLVVFRNFRVISMRFAVFLCY